jgi:hypothetical protein
MGVDILHKWHLICLLHIIVLIKADLVNKYKALHIAIVHHLEQRGFQWPMDEELSLSRGCLNDHAPVRNLPIGYTPGVGKALVRTSRVDLDFLDFNVQSTSVEKRRPGSQAV